MVFLHRWTVYTLIIIDSFNFSNKVPKNQWRPSFIILVALFEGKKYFDWLNKRGVSPLLMMIAKNKQFKHPTTPFSHFISKILDLSSVNNNLFIQPILYVFSSKYEARTARKIIKQLWIISLATFLRYCSCRYNSLSQRKKPFHASFSATCTCSIWITKTW